MSCPHCVCTRCDALSEVFPPAPLDAALEVSLWRQVDRAVERSNATRAAEAIGHFWRLGAPGPSRFEAPEGVWA